MRNPMLVFVYITLPLAAFGCGAKSSSLTTVPVSGHVTYNGSPVDGAVVAFSPKEGGTGFAASGTTNSEGQYKLVTYESAAKPLTGAVPGEYVVTITKIEHDAGALPKTGSMTPEAINSMSPEERAKMAGGPQQVGGRFVPPKADKNLLPAKYASASEPVLTITVTADQKDAIDFPLKD